MSDPLIDADELGTYLGDDTIDTSRAELIIADAQAACETVVAPIPDSKLFVLRRVAARAYLAGGGQARNYQLSQAGADQAETGPWAGVYLSKQDRMDLLDEDETPAPEAFTIRMNPATACGLAVANPYVSHGPGVWGWW